MSRFFRLRNKNVGIHNTNTGQSLTTVRGLPIKFVLLIIFALICVCLTTWHTLPPFQSPQKVSLFQTHILKLLPTTQVRTRQWHRRHFDRPPAKWLDATATLRRSVIWIHSHYGSGSTLLTAALQPQNGSMLIFEPLHILQELDNKHALIPLFGGPQRPATSSELRNLSTEMLAQLVACNFQHRLAGVYWLNSSFPQLDASAAEARAKLSVSFRNNSNKSSYYVDEFGYLRHLEQLCLAAPTMVMKTIRADNTMILDVYRKLYYNTKNRINLNVIHLWRHPFAILNSFKQRNVGFADWYRTFCIHLYEADYLRSDLLLYALRQNYQRIFYNDFLRQPEVELKRLLASLHMNYTSFHRDFLSTHMQTTTTAANCSMKSGVNGTRRVGAVNTLSICRDASFRPDKWRELPMEIIDYWNKSCHKSVQFFELAQQVHRTHVGHSLMFPFVFAQKLLLT